MSKAWTIRWGGALVLSLLLVPSAGAEVALAGKAGTLGVGAELTTGLSSQLNARFGINGYTYSERREASDIEYDADANLRNATAILDWHPGGRGFRLSGGLVYNANTVEGSSLPPASGVYDIGGVPVPVSLVGTLDAEVEFEPIVPYAGLGWGNALAGNGGWSFVLDLGVMFQGEGDVTLTPVISPNSPINTTPGAREALEILLELEAQDMEEDITEYDLYPVVAIGFSYRF